MRYHHSIKLKRLAQNIIIEFIAMNFLIFGITTNAAAAFTIFPIDSNTATVRNLPVNSKLLETLSAPPEFNWSDLKPVKQYLYEVNEAKKVEQQKIANEQKIIKEKIALANAQKATQKQTGSDNIPEYAGNDEQWSKSQVKAQLEKACDKYNISGSDRQWIIEAGLTIAWKESHYHIHSMNKQSSAAGIFQFLKAWSSLENRLDPIWSINRFVKVFADGGKAKIRQHWASTI